MTNEEVANELNRIAQKNLGFPLLYLFDRPHVEVGLIKAAMLDAFFSGASYGARQVGEHIAKARDEQ